MSLLPRLVITGAAAVTPLGRNLEATALALAEGRSAVAAVYPEGEAPRGASPAQHGDRGPGRGRSPGAGPGGFRAVRQA